MTPPLGDERECGNLGRTGLLQHVRRIAAFVVSDVSQSVATLSAAFRAGSGAEVMFVGCLCLVTPVAGIVSPIAISTGFVLISLSVFWQAATRCDALARAAPVVMNPQVVAALAFAVFLVLQAARAYPPDASSRIVQAGGLVALMFCVCSFVVLYHKEVRDLPIAAVVRVGLRTCIVLLALLMIYIGAIRLLAPVTWHAAMVKDIRDLNRYLEILAIFALIAPLIVWRHGVLSVIVLWGAVYASALCAIGYWPASNTITHVDSETVLIGMPIAFVTFALARAAIGLVAPLCFGTIAILISFAPWIYDQLYPLAVRYTPFKRYEILDRAEIWYGVALRIKSGSWIDFVFGRGKNFLASDGEFFVPGLHTTDMPAHPHNMILQLWLDCGLIGAAFVLFFLQRWWVWTSSVEESQRPAMLACTTMIAISASVSHAMWHTWFWSGAFSAIILMMALSRPEPAKQHVGESIQ